MYYYVDTLRWIVHKYIEFNQMDMKSWANFFNRYTKNTLKNSFFIINIFIFLSSK